VRVLFLGCSASCRAGAGARAWAAVSLAGARARQGLFIAILTVGGVLKSVDDGKNLQNFLICVEMLPAALGMLYAFPYTEYKGAGARPALACQFKSFL
jgi:hypothetical protein